MVTTRRTSTNETSSVLERSTSGGIGVLERTTPAINEFVNSNYQETPDQEFARMRGNLDKLLNYDRYSEVVEDSTATPVVEEAVAVTAEPVASQDEDIRPTTTTMQFGDADPDQIYNEMHRGEKEESGYKLNGKGKLVVVLYALAVTVILALIIINTGVLARLSGEKEARVAELNGKIEQYQQLSADIDSISGDEYVVEQAIQQGMVKR